MFRNKVLVRAKPPFSPTASPFHLLQLRLDPPPSSPSLSFPLPDRSSSSDLSSLFVKLEKLCWKLSRAWHVACLCFPHSPDIAIVYQRSQSGSVDQVVKEFVNELPVGNVGPEEKLISGSLVVKALECALRCAFLDSNWRCLGNNLFVYSDLSCADERRYLCALDVRVQLEMDDGIVFLVSPDVVRFSRYKISDLLTYKMEPNFYNGKEVTLENHNPVKPCYVLPFLHEGYVTGLWKVLPLGENLQEFEDLCSFKHGLALPNDYFIKIQFAFGGQANKKWLPSAFVLQGSALAPAPQTARVMKAVSALESFIKIVEGWNFFGQGWPRVQVMSSLSIGSEIFMWTKAAETINICASGSNSNPSRYEITSNFRSPKPAGFIVGYRNLEHTASLEETTKPGSLFEEHKTSKKIISLGDRSALSTKVGNKIGKSPFSGSPGKAREGTDTEERHMYIDSYKKDASSAPLTDSPFVLNRDNEIDDENNRVNPETIPKDPGKNAGKVTSMVQTSGRSLQEKQKSEVIHDNISLTGIKQDTHLEVSVKQAAHRREKSKNDVNEAVAKKKQKTQSDPSDITAKVMNYHTRGQLKSLTVAELKCFLSSKKGKVGGKKEDLIQRIITLLQ